MSESEEVFIQISDPFILKDKNIIAVDILKTKKYRGCEATGKILAEYHQLKT